MGKTRKYIISWNNYPPTLSLEDLKNKIINFAKTKYLIIAFEEGEKEHTKHIQGFVHFENPQHFENVRKLLINNDGTFGYLEEAKGNDSQNKLYCSKQGNYIEYGTIEKEEKANLSELFKDIEENKLSYIELCKKYAYYVLYHYKNFKELYQDIKKELLRAEKCERDFDILKKGFEFFGEDLKVKFEKEDY